MSLTALLCIQQANGKSSVVIELFIVVPLVFVRSAGRIIQDLNSAPGTGNSHELASILVSEDFLLRLRNIYALPYT